MRFPGLRPLTTLAAIALALAVANCSDGGSNNDDEFTPDDLERSLQRSFDNIPQMGDALTRVVQTLQGNPQPGVSFTNITGGVQGTVGVDLDGNGSMETTVSGTLTYIDPQQGIAAGANMHITGISGSQADGDYTGVIAPISPTAFAVSGSGGFSGEGVEVGVSGTSLSVDVATPTPVLDGIAFFQVNAEDGTMYFEDDGQGGFQLRVDFGGQEFVVP